MANRGGEPWKRESVEEGACIMNDLNVWIYGVADQVQSYLTRPGFVLAAATLVGAVVLALLLARALDWHAVLAEPAAPVLLGSATFLAQAVSLWSSLAHGGADLSPLAASVARRHGLVAAGGYGMVWCFLAGFLSLELFAYYRANRNALVDEPPALFRGARLQDEKPRVTRRLLVMLAFFLSTLGPFWFYVVLLDATSTSIWAARLPALPLALMAWLAGTAAVLAFEAGRARESARPGRAVRGRLHLIQCGAAPGAVSRSVPLEPGSHTDLEGSPWPPPAA